MRTVVVTGANGFIGGALCAALAGRARVRAVVRGDATGPWQESVRVDIARQEFPPGAFDGVDVVFHFAGKAHAIAERVGDEDEYRRVNVEGTRRVLEAARRNFQRAAWAAGICAALDELTSRLRRRAAAAVKSPERFAPLRPPVVPTHPHFVRIREGHIHTGAPEPEEQES